MSSIVLIWTVLLVGGSRLLTNFSFSRLRFAPWGHTLLGRDQRMSIITFVQNVLIFIVVIIKFTVIKAVGKVLVGPNRKYRARGNQFDTACSQSFLVRTGID